MQPAWSLHATGGVDAGAATAFAAGFGVVLLAMATLLLVLVAFVTLRSIVRAAGF